ncbi:hypothetical protein PpBr36_06879 [Pyricularia pennisetigena]|uniref:hypothetical protein n=1 Tax=Pyricularia pennisetigena TaxID=1578925 RepID=UPI001153CFF8|nr:hypothetical protein PpBr36_06879 [Pyricularia pennisetigena]TLS25786.1 hypothetical protein PpBr36_06879 [Pyricularia pennisetigena]
MPPKFNDSWYYPDDIAHDLDGVEGLSEALKQEAYACAWEYTRCVIPQYTNWDRYVAFMRTIIIGIIAEFRGELVDVAGSDSIMGCYSLSAVLDALFEGTPGHALMVREYKTFLLVTSEKTSKRRDSELFRRYVNGLAASPRHWFRMRDCDALARFSLAAALACNDVYDVFPTDDQFELLTEIGDTLYDAVAFYKHRSEGETNNTFAYVPADMRIQAFRVAREMLWALDVAYARKPGGAVLMNFIRFFGGPIHMMMRRYRFVEEDLTIGKPETAAVVAQTRRNFKLWNRVDAQGSVASQSSSDGNDHNNNNNNNSSSSSSRSSSVSSSGVSDAGSTHSSGADSNTTSIEPDKQDQQGQQDQQDQQDVAAEAPGAERFRSLMARSEELMFSELPTYLTRSGEPHCNRCHYRSSYGAQRLHRFGGVELCRGCRAMWRGYVDSLPERVQESFPDVVLKAPPPPSSSCRVATAGEVDAASSRRSKRLREDLTAAGEYIAVAGTAGEDDVPRSVEVVMDIPEAEGALHDMRSAVAVF